MLAAILAVVWLLFLPALDFGFLALDDQYGVATNPGIRDLSWRGIRFLFLEDQRDWRWFPLSYLSFAVDHALFDLTPRAVHRTNLLLHAANTALVFALVRSLTRDSLAAGVASLLFGVHPLQVESVAWISSRKTLLFLLFFLLAVLAYLPFARSVERRSPRALAALGASVFCFLLSMMAKPTGVTLPAVLLLVDAAVAPAPPARPIAFALRRLPSKLAYVPVIAFVAWMTARVSRPSPFGAEVSFVSFEWVVLVASNLGFYAAKAVVPIHLGVFYPLPNDGVPGLPWRFHALAVLGVALVALCVASWPRWRWVFFGLAWYLVTLLPSAVQPAFLHDPPVLAADRYFYQSSVGLFLVAGLGASALWRRLDDRAARAAVAGVAMAALALLLGLARQHVRVFRDAIPLYEQTLRHHPSDAFYYRLAIEYADAGRTASAFEALELAEQAPSRVFFGNLLGYQMRISDLYRRKGEPAKAAAFLARALDATPNAIETASAKTPLAYRWLASLWEDAGDFERARAARAAAETAAVDPSHSFESNWLVMSPEAAIAFLEKRVAEAPGDAVAWYYLGRGFHLYQQDERAIECLTRARELGFPP